MKIVDTILFALSAAFLLMGIHQSMKYGIQNSYFLFMLSSGLFLWYMLRKKLKVMQEEKKDPKKSTSSENRKRK
jgi:hypothetical protein